MIKKLCIHPACNNLCESGSYCNNHLPVATKGSLKATKWGKESNYKLYRTQKWKELRIEVLQENNNLCKECGMYVEGKNAQVDHIIAPKCNTDLFYDKNNLRVLCRRCHAIKTQKEIMDNRST